MNTEALFISFNEIDDELLERSEKTEHKKSIIKIKWVIPAACFCIIAFGFILMSRFDFAAQLSGIVQSDDTEIYATVMVNGELYEWHRDAIIYEVLPSDSIFYGNLISTDNDFPQNDCEVVSEIFIEGKIYTTSNQNHIYLVISTTLYEGVVVKFDVVK